MRGRIAVTFYSDARELGGAELSLANLLSTLSPRIEATIVGTNERVVGTLATRRPNVSAAVVPQIRSAVDVSAIREHLRAVGRSGADIVHINLNHPWACDWAQLAAIMARGSRVVAVEHLPRPPLRRRDVALKRLLESRLDAHVVVGSRSADELARLAHLPRGRLRTIHNGVLDVPLEPMRRCSDGFVVGSLGRLNAQKGYDVLIRALPQLEDVTAVVVGSGEERTALRRLADELGVGDRFVLHDWTNDARNYLTAFDAFVLPSGFEALPLTILEAMLAGLPVVATDVGSISEAVVDGSTGCLVAPGDSEALAAAIATLAQDRDRRQTMGELGRDRARKLFTADVMASRYEALYDELLS